MKYVGVNLSKYVQDFYAKKYKTLLREVKDVDRSRGTLLWVWTLNIVKMPILLKLIDEFNAFPIKALAGDTCYNTDEPQTHRAK